MRKRPSSCSALEAAAPDHWNLQAPSYFCRICRELDPPVMKRKWQKGLCYKCFMHSGESNTFQSHMSCRLCGPARVSKVKCARSGERFCSQCAHDMCPEVLAQNSGSLAIPLDGPRCFSCFRADIPIAQYGCEVSWSVTVRVQSGYVLNVKASKNTCPVLIAGPLCWREPASDVVALWISPPC